MRRARRFIRERIGAAALLAVCAGIFAGVLSLYRMPAEAVGYAGALCAAVLLLWGGVRFLWWRRRIRRLEELEGRAALALDQLPEPESLEAETYQRLLLELDEVRRQVSSAADARERETLDYYTMWVHQIKTPIAAIGLLLQGDETDRGRELRSELFRVEQYVTMALSYLRLGAETTDYVIRKQDLDPILRQAARKYAALFIRGRVALALRPTGLRVLTDEKWLQLVVEQLLSNAVKYAPGGHVTVYARDSRLIIEDDGVGIAREDLPRIFERGFTGCNGRLDKRATGIGLYLCREICRRLGHTITVDAEPGRGTRVIIGLERPFLEVE